MSFLGSDSDSGISDNDVPRAKSKEGTPRSKGKDGIVVNQEFAKRFERRKRQQELKAAKHLNLESRSDEDAGEETDSESETEDEDGDMLTPALDLQIIKTINKIRSQDPEIYDKHREWFAAEPGGGEGDTAPAGESESAGRAAKHAKKMRYKDVLRQQILQAETAEDAISSDEDDGRRGGSRGRQSDQTGQGTKGFAYDEEQENLRRTLLGSIADQEKGGADEDGKDGDDNDLLQVRQKSAEQLAEEEAELKEEAEKMALLGRKTGDSEGGDGEDDFLVDFMKHRRWRDPDSSQTPSYEEILKLPHVEDSEDEEAIDEADEFESKYNFRFEEEGGTEIVMHSRDVAGSMRRKDDKRKRERENRKNRKAEERKRKELELRRLKNIKRAEIQKRLKAIQEMSGGALLGEERVNNQAGDAEALVDGDFDADKWDKLTGQAFGESYYDAKDTDHGWKPGDDPLEGLGDLDQYGDGGDMSAGGHGVEDGNVGYDEGDEGFANEEGNEEWGDEDDEWEEGANEEGIGFEKERLLDELYKLDYEDIIGDLPCRCSIDFC